MHFAEWTKNGDNLMLVVTIRGDMNIETVRRHYFNFGRQALARIEGWDLPLLPLLSALEVVTPSTNCRLAVVG